MVEHRGQVRKVREGSAIGRRGSVTETSAVIGDEVEVVGRQSVEDARPTSSIGDTGVEENHGGPGAWSVFPRENGAVREDKFVVLAHTESLVTDLRRGLAAATVLDEYRGVASMGPDPGGPWAVGGESVRMAIKLENVGIAVRDLEATISFFIDLGLTLVGRDEVSGDWTDTAVGLDGNHAKIAMLQTPDGHGVLELFEYIHPDAIDTEPTQPNQIGMHRVAFSVDNIDDALAIAAQHGCFPLRGVATYQDVYKLSYVRGPSGIIVMLAQELKKV